METTFPAVLFGAILLCTCLALGTGQEGCVGSVKHVTTASQPRTLNITWDPPSSDPACFYNYTMHLIKIKSLSDSSGSSIHSLTTRETYGIFDNLTPCTEYKLSVKAINIMGDKTSKGHSPSTTFEVPDPVENLNVTEFLESDTLAVSWDDPLNVDCVTEYVVKIYNQSECRETEHAVLKASANSINITGVLPGSLYTVRVYARNSLGSSSVAESGTLATTVPGSVSDSLTADKQPDTLTISWDPPANSTCISDYKLHLVTYKSESDPSGSAIQSLNTNKTYFIFESLTNCTEYKTSVQAVNDMGGLGPLAKLVVDSSYEVPDHVRNLIVLEEMDSLAVSWNHSLNIDCVLEYVVELYNHSVDLCSKTDYVTGQVVPEIKLTTTKNFVNLAHSFLPGSPYTVRVYARNRLGNSSVAKHGTMATEAPIQNIRSRNTSLTFSWDQVPCGNIIGINSYEYTLKLDDTILHSGTTNELEVILDDLQPCTTYTFSISVVNDKGEGMWSSSVTGTTEKNAPTNAPDNVQNIRSTNTSLTFSWDQVTCGNTGGINSYEYTLKHDDSILYSNTTNDLEVILDRLQPCTTYNFSIRAVNDKGEHMWSSPVAGTTGQVAPTKAPRNIQNIRSTNTTLAFSWEQVPCGNRGGINSYIYILKRDDTMLYSDTTNDLEVTLDGLQPCTNYTFSIRAINGMGEGILSSPVSGTTEQVAPTKAPGNVQNIQSTNTTLAFSWEQVPCGNRGGINSYKYILERNDTILYSNTTNDLEVTLDGLQPCTNYTFSIRAVNDMGEGILSSPVSGTTVQVGKPPTVLQTDRSVDRMTISWNASKLMYCEIISYQVQVRTFHKPYNVTFKPSPESELILNITNGLHIANLDGLFPSTQYEIAVCGVAEAGVSNCRVELFYTAPANSTKYLGDPLMAPDPVAVTGTSATIVIPQLDSASKPLFLTEYQILVESSPASRRKRSGTTSQYVAGRISASEAENGPVEFTVGDGMNEDNSPLDEDKEYLIYIGSCSVVDEESACVLSEPFNFGNPSIQHPTTAASNTVPNQNQTTSSNTASIVIPIIIILVFAGIVSVTTVAFQRRKPRKRKPESYVNLEMNTCTDEDKRQKKTGAVKVTDFKEHVAKRKSGKGISFQDEYQMLPAGVLFTHDIAKKKENLHKNRYKNISPYDDSRVVLNPIENDPCSDYINASFIDGFLHPKGYIATQGPTEETVGDFWRMMWQLNLNTIVMLTNLVESGKTKCDKYWPDSTGRYGNIAAVLKQTDVYNDYIVRIFTLSDLSFTNCNVREVYQFHFTTWPDMHVPEDSSPLLSFMSMVKRHTEGKQEPTVVHCSAGVGRTGTFITIASMLSMAQKKKEINIFDFVSRMRQNRIKMVQTSEQYEFIHDAILVHLTYGNTCIPVTMFTQTYSKLKMKDGRTKKSGLVNEFKNLQKFTVLPDKNHCLVGFQSDNADKNRFKDLVPMDSYRPYLVTMLDDKDSDYINATFLPGYESKSIYLTTQMPLPNTVGDIWRMIYDFQCSTLVMLNKLDGQSMSQYWPGPNATLELGPLSVKCVSVNVGSDIITRVFNISKNSKDFNTVVQFTPTSWRNEPHEMPTVPNVLAVARKVLDRMQKLPEDRVCVHCIDGNSVSSTFCAILSTLHSITSEMTVDIFQTVKQLRKCNPRAVQTKEQYNYIYDVVQEQLDFSYTYENGIVYQSNETFVGNPDQDINDIPEYDTDFETREDILEQLSYLPEAKHVPFHPDATEMFLDINVNCVVDSESVA